ncbi:MAG: hypothetical protein ACI9MR_004485 [Myxococcota bacterium]|jgi:hypothetical protein
MAAAAAVSSWTISRSNDHRTPSDARVSPPNQHRTSFSINRQVSTPPTLSCRRWHRSSRQKATSVPPMSGVLRSVSHRVPCATNGSLHLPAEHALAVEQRLSSSQITSSMASTKRHSPSSARRRWGGTRRPSPRTRQRCHRRRYCLRHPPRLRRIGMHCRSDSRMQRHLGRKHHRRPGTKRWCTRHRLHTPSVTIGTSLQDSYHLWCKGLRHRKGRHHR